MSENSQILYQMLQSSEWLNEQTAMKLLKASDYWQLLLDFLQVLNRKALFASPIHGEGHIERVMLLGTLLAKDNHLNEEDADLLLHCCSYHDVGRVDDSYDLLHGYRSSLQLAALTGKKGEALKLMQAAVEAHSILDDEMDRIISKYDPSDLERYRKIARILKDSDGLDRVRLDLLDPKYLRTSSSRDYVDFANHLFLNYNHLR